ncbi:E3 ubiquitin-protein ligase [Chlorella vulgaris]
MDRRLQRQCECPVCFEYFTEPSTLPCGHTFCMACIQRWLGNARNQRRCPLCKTTVPYGHELRVNILLRDLVQTLQEHEEQEERQQQQQCLAAEQQRRQQQAAEQDQQQQHAASQQQHQRQQAADQQQQLPSECPGLADPADEQQQREASDAASPTSVVMPPWPLPQQLSADHPQTWWRAALRLLAGAAAGTAQLLLHLLLSPAAGRLRDAAWLAAAVALPPALAVWGWSLVWALLLAAATLLLAASRCWSQLAVLLGAAAVMEAVAWAVHRVPVQHCPSSAAAW